jgi:hypothetical protein
MPASPGVGSGIVILIPLKVSSNIGKGGTFINAFASSIPNILGGTPDILTGFPDVQVTGLTSWNVADILQSDRPFYTWTTKDGTRVIVMAEPIGISDGDMTNIKRLPITTPGDAIHEIADNIFYKSAPPLDASGNPVKCKKPFTIMQPPLALKEQSARTNQGAMFLGGLAGFLTVLFAVWLALWLTTGPGATFMKSISNGLGNLMVKSTRQGQVAQTSRTPEQRAAADARIAAQERKEVPRDVQNDAAGTGLGPRGQAGQPDATPSGRA